MLTFKQSLIVLVSIITILAIIAIGTGLSPLYWPLPKALSQENNSSIEFTTKPTNSSDIKTRIRPIPKLQDQITTIKLITAMPIPTNMLPVNATII